MNTRRALSLIFIFLLLVLAVAIRSHKPEDMEKEMNSIGSEINKLNKMILENERLSRLLRDHESRLKVLAVKPKIYRLPVLIEGKDLCVTLNESDLEDLSNSLALDDLLLKHKVTKGGYRSDDPQEWKKILIRINMQAKDHLRDVELPAINKRIDDVDQEANTFAAKRDKLFDRYKAL
jgi:hypothetical protein